MFILRTLLVLSISLNAFADKDSKIALFTCKNQFSPFNMEFQQGDDYQAKVYYHPKQNGLSLQLLPWVGPSIDIYNAQETSRYYAQLQQSRFLIIWNEIKTQKSSAPYMLMVYVGDNNWGAVVRISDEAKKRHDSLSHVDEIEFLCRETPALNDVKFQSN